MKNEKSKCKNCKDEWMCFHNDNWNKSPEGSQEQFDAWVETEMPKWLETKVCPYEN
jgi:hypothetical protein